MGAKVVKNFIKGLDLDTDERLVEGYRYALNCRGGTSESDNVGCIENIKGNTLVSFALPDGINKCIGTCEDLENNGVIFFVYNSNKENLILRYNISANNITKILHQTTAFLVDLNFDPDHLITNCFVIQNLLYWNDDINPPRKINIDKAKLFTSSLWYFYDNYFVDGSQVGEEGNYYVGFYNPDIPIPSNIGVGTQIIVQQNTVPSINMPTNPQYNTIATVIAIDEFNNRVVTDIPFAGNTVVNGGYIIPYYPFTYYTVITEQVIDRIKHPPHFSPIVEYYSEEEYKYNNLRGSTFQFAFAYIYDDNEKSTLSPISKLPIPQYEEITQNGYYNNVITENNVIKINFKTGIDTIKAILIYGRCNAETTGDNPVTVSANYSDWFLIERIEKYKLDGTIIINSNIDDTYKFYNNKVKNFVNQSDARRLFDYVPQYVGASELIEKNRILDGDITEGYDNVDIDIILEVQRNLVSTQITDKFIPIYIDTSIPATTNFHTTLFKEVDIYKFYPNNIYQFTSNYYIKWNYKEFTDETYYRVILPTQEPEIGSLINIIFSVGKNNEEYYTDKYSIEYTLSDSYNYPKSIKDKLLNLLKPSYPVGEFGDSNDYEFYIAKILNYLAVYLGTDVPNMSILSATLNIYYSPIIKVKSFKSGAEHPFGIVYYDRANRSGATNINSQSVIYVPLITEIATGSYTKSIYQNQIRWTIKHKPPIEATHYQWVYGKNTSLEEYLQYNLFPSIHYDIEGMVRIPFNTSITTYNLKSHKSILADWIFQKGDRIRILMKININIDYGYWQYMNTKYPEFTQGYMPKLDFEIIGYDVDTFEFICEYFDINLISGDNDFIPIIEVYRPKKQFGEQLFYEIGENFEIGNPHTEQRYHKGSIQDQSANYPLLQPAVGVFDSGDCYVRYRWCSLGNPTPLFYFPCESEHLSDFYVSDSCDIGRPNIVDRNQEQRRLKANFRFGGKLLQDTQINDMSRFDYLDAEQLPDKYGAIEKLIVVGDVLKIIQNKKVSSLYLGLSATAEADAGTNLYVKKYCTWYYKNVY